MKKDQKSIVLLLFLLISISPVINSDLYNLTKKIVSQSPPWKWENLGPYGGDINKISINPNNPQELYILVSSLGNIFYSQNKGNSWEKIAGFNRECSDMAIDPNDPETFYVVSYSNVFKSTDRGQNWETIDLGNECNLSHIAVDPMNPQIIHITGSYGTEEYQAMYRSKNGGKTWSYKIINSSVSGGGTFAIAISPLYPNNVLISGAYQTDAGMQNRLYKSTNAGNSWEEVTNPINSLVTFIAFDPQDPLRMYTISSWGIYLSSDGGSSWNKAKNLAWGYSLAIDPINPNIIYAGANALVYKSLDKGENWTQFRSELRGTCNTLAAYSSTVYFGSEYGLFKSQDEGLTWTSSHQGIGNMKITLLAVAQSSPNVIYARAENAGFYKTQDYGKNWIELDTSSSCNNIREFVVNPRNSQELFALSGG